MKNIFLLFISIAIISCGGEANKSNPSGEANKPNPSSIAEKTIKQKIDMDGLGMIKDIKMESVNQIDGTTFEAVHIFTNPMVNKKMRVTRKYYLNSSLDSVMKKEDIKTEMETEGEFKVMFQ